MTTLVAERTVDSETAEATLLPRTGLVRERDLGGGRFEAEVGPVAGYRREVRVEPLGDGRCSLRQTVQYDLAVPFWRWIFAWPARTHLGRTGGVAKAPWWASPDPLDAQASISLSCLAALSVVAGYLGVLLSQTITYAVDEFGASTSAQGFALASVRVDILIALPLVALADRRGRRRILLLAAAGACVLTMVTALTPSLVLMMTSQVPARGLATAAAIAITVIAAEEMPAGSRAWAISLLAMSAALGAGICVILLFIAGLDERGWRILFLLGGLGLPLVRAIAARLPESRRYRAPHADATMAGHGARFWLLAASAFLLALFTTPASQFQNDFLKDEMGFSAPRISLFSIATNTPGVIGIIVGGRLADMRGRRLVGSVAIIGGVGATLLMYLSGGWTLWAWSVVGAIIGSATVPALGVYGPELFPTALRGKANGIISGLGRLGSVVGLVTAGILADRFDRLGPALLVLALGPLALAILVLARYPETAHRELEDLNPEDRPPPPVTPG